MVGFSLKHNAENNVRFAYVSIAYRCDREQSARYFGPELTGIAFGGMKVIAADGETPPGVDWGFKAITPDAKCEFHEIEILGHKQSLQPVLKQIRPVKDEQKITVTLELPILIKDKTLAGALVTEFGKIVDVEFNPAQLDLKLEQGNAEGGVVIKKGKFGNPEPVAAGA